VLADASGIDCARLLAMLGSRSPSRVHAVGRGHYRHVQEMAKRDPRMIPLGYGKFVRADRVYALVPIEGAERRDGRRTYVHVDGLTEPVVASRSERAILADVEAALAEAAGLPRRRRSGAAVGQESLL
jgi:hypothetical protein